MKKSKSKTRLFLIEDNRILREGMIAMLKPYTDMVVTASDCINTISKIEQTKPDVVLLDLSLRNHCSLNIVKKVKRKLPGIKMIILHLIPETGDIIKFIKAGTDGFILKDATLDVLITTIRAVKAGQKVLPDILTESLFSHIIDDAVKKGTTKVKTALKLSIKEKQILSLISDTVTNAEIGRSLNVSAYLVKSYIHNIIEKLAMHSRLENSAAKI